MMLKYIDKRLDKFFDSDSPLYADYDYYEIMCKEIFEYLETVEHSMPEEYEYELKRCRDLIACVDFARKKEKGREKERIKQIKTIEKRIKYIEELKKKI
ncbi:MAG: hypothetical protein HY738_18445 [Bacteroidia bacterium]|nr:hypothetical protein [Bacteroidia bacterium]